MKLALAMAIVAIIAGCAVSTPDGDLTITIPAIDIDVQPEYRNRVHLTREWVERGIRYCRYSDGQVTRRRWRDGDCPRLAY